MYEEDESKQTKDQMRDEISLLTSMYLQDNKITVVPFGVSKEYRSKMQLDFKRVRDNGIRKRRQDA